MDYKFELEWLKSGKTLKWRPDGKCGRSFLLPDWTPAQCDPDSEKPCCDSSGECGNTPEQCLCFNCTDYSIIHRDWTESQGRQKWRYDGKCSRNYPLPDGSPAECDPDGHNPCCNNQLDRCGNDPEHCSCTDCEDFKFAKKWRESGGTLNWRNDQRCGIHFSLPNGLPAQCDPNGAYPCCGSNGEFGYSQDHCSCEDCVNYRILQGEWKESGGTLKWRYDGRCGENYPLFDGTPAQCDPDGANPCCSSWGRCGNTAMQCFCQSCVDYKFVKDWISDNKPLWRYDGKCGYYHSLPDGSHAQCDPDSEAPCCNDISYGLCGSTAEYCTCEGCSDYRRIYREWRESAGKKKWRYDGKCGSFFPLPDGSPAQCNPDGPSPCCSSFDRGVCGNTAEHCLCQICSDYKLVYSEWTESNGTNKWRHDKKCGSASPLPDGAPAECDPEGTLPCCPDIEFGLFCYGYSYTIDCFIYNSLDYRLVNKVRESGQNCTMVRLESGFLKHVCFDERERQLYFRCLQSDVHYELKWKHPDSDFAVSRVCPEDPYAYQVCGFSTKVSNSDVLCGGYICPFKKSGVHHFIKCTGESCESGRRHCVNSSAGISDTEFTTLCDDECDMPYCEDEGYCNGYRYGVDCRWNDFDGPGDYLPAHLVCVVDCEYQEQICNFTDSDIKTCTHYNSVRWRELTVPILNNTRCSVFGPDNHKIPPYCLDYSDQTNCSDIERVGGFCKIDGFISSVSKFVVCKNFDSVTNKPIELCDDGFQNVCLYLQGSDCTVHRHKMCDKVKDCTDGGDEVHDMCKKMTSPSKFTCTRSFNIKHGNATIPSSWILDNITDCLDGSDENEDGDWRYCNGQIHLDELDCQDYFKCPRNNKLLVPFEQLCDGIESCGDNVENNVCRVARDFPDIKTIAPLKISVRNVTNTTCESQKFERPWGDIIGEHKMEFSVPTHKVDCSEMFGEHYLYLSCMNLCSEDIFTCPLNGEGKKLVYDSCPGQYSNRSYTLGNSSFLTFLDEADNGRYHQDFYRCNNSKCVEYKHVCDLVDDCGDMSDEMNCANHLICNDTLNTTKYQFIALSQRCDGIYDCFDLSDECNGGCGKEILDYDVLKFICWLLGVLATVFNVFALVMGIVSLKSCATESMMTSKILMSLIGVGDILIGLYLVTLSFYDSVVYGQEFCKHQIEWLTGIPCLMLGIISTLGSQISLFTMTVLSVIRMYGLTCKPMRVPGPINRKSIIRVTILCVSIITAAFVIAVTPLAPFLEDYFVQGILYNTSFINHSGFPNKMFVGFPNKERHIRILNAYYKSNRTGNNSDFTTTMSWREIGENVDRMFTRSQSYLTRTPVHFYGNDGVCLFKYFVRTNDARRTRQSSTAEPSLVGFQDPVVWTMLAVNLFCFIVITFCYIVIICKTRQSSQRSGQQDNPERVKEEKAIQNKIILIIATDFLCWVPFIIISALHNFNSIDASNWYTSFAMTVLPLNSVINPLVYDKALGELIKRTFEGHKRFFSFVSVSGIAMIREFYGSLTTNQEQVAEQEPEILHMDQIVIANDMKNDVEKDNTPQVEDDADNNCSSEL